MFMYIYIFTCMYIYVYICIYIYIHIHICIYMYVYIYVYTYVCLHTHTSILFLVGIGPAILIVINFAAPTHPNCWWPLVICVWKKWRWRTVFPKGALPFGKYVYTVQSTISQKMAYLMYVYSYLTCMLQCSIACICVDALNCVYVLGACIYMFLYIKVSPQLASVQFVEFCSSISALRFSVCGIPHTHSNLVCGTRAWEQTKMRY